MWTRTTSEQVRRGVLRVGSAAALPTPMTVISCSLGAVPNLTPDTLELALSADGSAGLLVDADYVLSALTSTQGALATGDMDLRRFLGIPPHRLLLTALRESAVIEAKAGNTDAHVMVDSLNGRQRCTVEDYARLARALAPSGNPTLLGAIADLPAPYPTEKRLKRCVDRTARFRSQLQASLEEQPQPSSEGVALRPPEMLDVVFGHSAQAAKGSLASLAEVPAVAARGVILCGFDLLTPAGVDVLQSTLSGLTDTTLRVMLNMQSPDEVATALRLGVDVVDTSYCAADAALGRAVLFPTEHQPSSSPRFAVLDLWDPVYARDSGPIEPSCGCLACRRHTRGYIHHLLCTHELLATVLLTSHNLYGHLRFVRETREQRA